MWVQRAVPAPMGETTSDEYRGCLDALIDTLAELDAMRHKLATQDRIPGEVWMQIVLVEMHGQKRAAECAWLLFERWIEVVP